MLLLLSSLLLSLLALRCDGDGFGAALAACATFHFLHQMQAIERAQQKKHNHYYLIIYANALIFHSTIMLVIKSFNL